MTPQIVDAGRLEIALEGLHRELLEERAADGAWRGKLSASALSTATATFALSLVDHRRGTSDYRALIDGGRRWLCEHANRDGGWGDTVCSASNISTTTLCWSALSAERADGASDSIRAAEAWIREHAGSLEPAALCNAIVSAYGKDRTFSVPILTMCALAGRLGEGRRAWRAIPQLPFELAVFPRRWFRHIGLPVVSYALPALIAVGQARHALSPSRNPLWRRVRDWSRRPTLRLLDEIQPESGGFLEAAPLTSFVAMSLAASGRLDHPVLERGLRFLESSVAGDGSWPIDTDLATWVTTLAVNALEAGGALGDRLTRSERETLCDALLNRQYRDVHPYTGAAPGGWAWTDRSGGVPDADDTAGALLALHCLSREGDVSARTGRAAAAGVRWLLGLQNRDGGVPTFCRGWGKLPFDRSGSDLTAHVVRAWLAWRQRIDPSEPGLRRGEIDRALERALEFLVSAQRADGSWVPLWFGNEAVEGFENPAFGTSRVLLAVVDVARAGERRPSLIEAGRRGVEWLTNACCEDGGWGGAPGAPPSMEETALAVEALAAASTLGELAPRREVLDRGVAWILRALEAGRQIRPTPIGFYFANLWYSERLYPLAFAAAALGRAARLLREKATETGRRR